jgi:hypothetical protein
MVAALLNAAVSSRAGLTAEARKAVQVVALAVRATWLTLFAAIDAKV